MLNNWRKAAPRENPPLVQSRCAAISYICKISDKSVDTTVRVWSWCSEDLRDWANFCKFLKNCSKDRVEISPSCFARYSPSKGTKFCSQVHLGGEKFSLKRPKVTQFSKFFSFLQLSMKFCGENWRNVTPREILPKSRRVQTFSSADPHARLFLMVLCSFWCEELSIFHLDQFSLV